MPFPTTSLYALDKDFALFGQNYHDPCNDFFDQFLTFDTADTVDTIDKESAIFPLISDSTDLVKSVCNSQAAGTHPTLRGQESIQGINHLRGKLSHFTQNATSTHLTTSSGADNLYFEDSGRAAISDSDLLSLECINLESPRLTPLSPSLPSTPTHSQFGARSLRRTSRFIRSITKPFSRSRADSEVLQRSPIRKPSSPAKMNPYDQQNIGPWPGHYELVNQKFNFGFPNSPPPSTKLSDASGSGNMMVAQEHHNSQQGNQLGHQDNQHDTIFAWDRPPVQFNQDYANLHTPDTTPPSDVHTFNQSNLPHPSADDLAFSQSAHQNQASTAWKYQPELDEYEHPTQSGNNDNQVWWNSSDTPILQPSPSGYLRVPGQGQGQVQGQNTKTLATQLQNELAFNANELALSPSSMAEGLMIQMPSPNRQPYVVDQSPLTQQGYFQGHHLQQHQMQPLQHHYTQSQPIPSSQQFAVPTMHLRKSRSYAEASKSPSPTSGARPRTPSYHVVKRRSASRLARDHPPTPKTPKSGDGSMSFVNFTPDDSSKILTGVAPSGSSKTKARREKEAMEKRRRLSYAAIKAIRDAGGDVDSLIQEGIILREDSSNLPTQL